MRNKYALTGFSLFYTRQLTYVTRLSAYSPSPVRLRKFHFKNVKMLKRRFRERI